MCRNRRFQLQQDALVFPFKTAFKGYGLAAGEHIAIGTFVIQYVGEVFDTETKNGRERLDRYKGSTCTYLMKTHKSHVIDPSTKGNLARFINHSCDPNCETQKWTVLGETCVGIFAIKDIKEGEEITFDYRFDSYSTALTKCFCGATNCKGYLGVVPPTMSPEKWEKSLQKLPCVVCGSVEDAENNQMLLCDDCNRGFHALCLDPPLKEIPKEGWYCFDCLKKKLEATKNPSDISPISPKVSEQSPSVTWEEILKCIKEVNDDIKSYEDERKSLSEELKNTMEKEKQNELNSKIARIDRKYLGYSKNFLYFFLLQKKIKKKITKQDQQKSEASSPRKKQASIITCISASCKNETPTYNKIAKEVPKAIAESEVKIDIPSMEKINDFGPITLQKIQTKEVKDIEMKDPPLTKSLPTPRSDLAKNQKEELQRELEIEVKKVLKKKEEESRQQASFDTTTKQREVFKVPSRELDNIRLCLNVCFTM